MPRVARKNIESSYCHVIVQGINKEYIFKENYLKDAYKNLIKKCLGEIDVKILSYCIMDNHAHFLIYSDKIEYITKLMRRVNTSYAMLYNSMNNRAGYVFRDRYYTQTILSEEQLFNCVVYIHDNPVKAKIVSKMSEYKYSSYREYIGKKDLITNEGIKLVFGSSKNYIETFKEIHKKEEIENIIDIIEKEASEKIIEDFLKEKGRKLEEIEQNEDEFRELLLRLRHNGRSIIKRNG